MVKAKTIRLIILSYLFIIFSVSFCPAKLFAVESSPKKITTTVTVTRGVVTVYEIPMLDKTQGIITGIIREGVFINKVSEDEAVVLISDEPVSAYIPQIIRQELNLHLSKEDSPVVLVEEKIRKNTRWDIIAVGYIVGAGREYAFGEVTPAEKAKLEEMVTEPAPVGIGEGPTTPIRTEPEQPRVQRYPVAVISVDKVYGEAPLTVSFDGSGSSDSDGTIESYSWNFGDGATGTGAKVSHTYNSQGTFTVKLTVTDNDGNTGSITISITTENITVYYVKTDGNDDNSGTSWDYAFKTIGKALSKCHSAHTINVAAGTYNEHSLQMKSDVTITGAGKGSTIIDAAGSNVTAIECKSVSNVTIEKLTVKNGIGSNDQSYITYDGVTHTGLCGGGLFYSDCTGLTISECAFENNNAPFAGGAIGSINPSSQVAITDCTFKNNSAGIAGGAVIITSSNSTISGCSFENNSSSDTASGFLITACSSVTVSNCAFTGNSSPASNGSAVNIGTVGTTSNITFNDCTVSNNAGVGVYIFGGAADFNRCKIQNNTAGPLLDGGGVEIEDYRGGNSTFTNCLITGNTGDKGGVWITSATGTISPVFMNCTIAGNTSNEGQGEGFHLYRNAHPVITNCIIYNTNYDIYVSGTGNAPIITYTDVFNDAGFTSYNNGAIGTIANYAGWGWGGTDCFAVNPEFKGGGKYYLSSITPASIKTGGTPSEAFTFNIDIDSRARSSTNPSMGCYEYFAGDPLITGKVYDSVTGENISSPNISLYKKDETTAYKTTTDNPYRFDVDIGQYFIIVEKECYTFPSNTIASKTAGDHGEVFALGTGNITIDIPIDPGYPLEITKTSNKKRVMNGDILTYNISIQNKSTKAVSNIILKDHITNGFKYVNNSTYKDSKKQDDPTISSRLATYNIGTVNGSTTVNLSYQVRIGTGICPGRYTTTALCRETVRDWQMSNETEYAVEVIMDPLFSKGTIIGKVFLDLNANGVQDRKKPETSNQKPEFIEVGIAGVRIATEYGVVVETDEDGKYHIADVPAGTHLLKVDSSSLPNSELRIMNYEFTTENPYLVKITEGLLAKVNFGLAPLEQTKEKPVTSNQKPEKEPQIISDIKKFFIVALAEGIVRDVKRSGNIEMVEKDDRYDKGIKVDGKLALYLKGKILGKYLITASLDTDSRKETKKQRIGENKLFTNLDPDKYYPIYGDASKVDYSATDTQDMVYVLVEWDESFAKWGSFHTEMPLYNRSLSGGIINYQSIKKTKFDKPYTRIKTFYAVSRQVPAHDEFVGTGGSLYYLRHRDVVEGSEKLTVEIRDRISKIAIASFTLAEEKDYQIDYDTGRIILKKPLNSVTWAYYSSIVSNNTLAGENVYLVVDYEYMSDTELHKQSWGAYGSQWIGDHVRVGGGYIEESKSGDPYKLASGDGTIKINKDTEINGIYAHSEETQLGGSTSWDGGLSFISQSTGACNGKSGSSVGIDAKTKLFNNTDIYAAYSKQDRYFSATDTLTTQGTTKYIAGITSQLKENLKIGVRHVTQTLLDATIVASITGDNKNHITNAFADWTPGKWDLRGEYQHQIVSNPIQDYTWFGTRQFLDNDFVAGRIGYQLTERIHPYIRGQGTVNGDPDNEGTVGLDLTLWKSTYLNLAETVGNLGNSTLLGITSKYTEDTDIYANLEVGNNLRIGRFNKTTYGQSTKLTKTSRAYVETDYSSWNENIVRGNILGYEKKISDSTAFGLTYERADLEKPTQAISRDAVSGTISYLDLDFLELFTKLEMRNDSGSTETRQWTTENKCIWYMTRDISLLGRANWSLTDNRTDDTTEARFHELGLGAAYRPVNFDRLNLLAKYSYITDLGPDSQTDFPESTDSRKNVYAIEGAFDICRYLQLVGKFAYRVMEDKVGPRDWTDSDTYLYIGRLNFHVTNKWDIAGEYRTLANRQIEDKKSGWLIEVDRELFKYARLGVGYNFTDYDDDLSNSDNYDAKGWFVRVNGKY